MNTAPPSSADHYLSALDYILFGASLAFSLSVGIYHGCVQKRGQAASTTKDVLFAGGQLGAVPVAMSLVTTFLSAISLLGYPGEIYKYGTMFCYYGLMYFVAFPTAAYVFLPLLYKLQLPSAYQYLELRFDSRVKRVASFIFCLQTVLYLSVGLYAPALTLNSVMGFPLFASIAVTGFVCVLYTSIGGAKTVVWTNVYQFVLILGGLLSIVLVGLNYAGGFGQVFRSARDGRRIEFSDFNPDPRIRHCFWSLMIGGTFTLLSLYCTNQMTVQRYVSMKSLKQAQIALLLNIPLNLIIISMYTLIGLILFASFYGCNPESLGLIKKPAEVLPYFVAHKLSYLKGLPGIFLSAVYGAGLSTVASGLNSLAAVALEDCLKPAYSRLKGAPMLDASAASACKALAFTFGLLTIFLAYAFTKIQAPILQVALSLFGIGGGPILGTFCLGMFFRRPNAHGALIGLLVSVMITSWIGIAPIFTGVRPSNLPTSTSSCPTSSQMTHSGDFTLFSNDTTPLSSSASTTSPSYFPLSIGMSDIFEEPTTAAKSLSSSSSLFSVSSRDDCAISPNGKSLSENTYLSCQSFLLEIYKLSYQYYSLLAVLLVISVGYTSSLIIDFLCTTRRRGQSPTRDLYQPADSRYQYSDLHVNFGDIFCCRESDRSQNDYDLADKGSIHLKIETLDG